MLRRAWIGDAELWRPLALGDQRGQYAAQRVLLAEEADAADADGVVALHRQAGYQIGGVEDERVVCGGLAAGEARREEAGMVSWSDGRGQEPGEEGMVCGVGEAAGRVPLLPSARRQHRRQVWRAPLRQQVARHVVAQRVERDEQDVVGADQVARADHVVPSSSMARISAS